MLLKELKLKSLTRERISEGLEDIDESEDLEEQDDEEAEVDED